MLVDTHAHIHFDDYAGRLPEVLANAQAAGVEAIICVGVDEIDSAKAIQLVKNQDLVLNRRARPGLEAVKLYATVGLHPHDAGRGPVALEIIAALAKDPEVVAIGECGLDFYRNLSSRSDQEQALRFQIELALRLNKPMVWHVRDAFDEFFEIVDQYKGVRGIVHCFTSNRVNMEAAVERGFLIALNGIMTFTKDPAQLVAAQAVPLNSLVLETDCPFLAPSPLRGHTNEPANLLLTAQFLADLRSENIETLAGQTSMNALKIFGIK